ncbi:Ferrochelatase [Halomonadaceae bacterium LMG 33818]|uniref:ferrochelatase n=1 Tax=Cernens ardua TaxID=3402176 RepID=UPI003EDBBCE5
MPKPRFGVLMVNLGTPDQPTTSAVRRYLREFLSDPRVVDTPRPLWLPILYGIVLTFRPVKVAKAYESIWFDNGSPLLVISRQQQAILKKNLSDQFGEDIPVELGMTYGQPRVDDALASLQRQGVERVIVMPMYPQYSSSTTASVFDCVAKALNKMPNIPELRMIKRYCDDPDYIAALASSVEEHWEKQGRRGHLVMSFHGVPKRYVEVKGDPYYDECSTTSRLVAEKLGLSEDQWTMTFQSRFGREEWLQPYTDMTLEEWGKTGKYEAIDIMSPAFAADCLETLEELSVENRDNYTEAGGGDYAYIPALNDREDHMAMLTRLITDKVQGW